MKEIVEQLESLSVVNYILQQLLNILLNQALYALILFGLGLYLNFINYVANIVKNTF